MDNGRKFSLFISSTYEDLLEERKALMEVALDNNFIPVGMEQFYAVPTDQWNVITKMIDECDFYLVMIAGRYGSIDDKSGKSYTENEYNYAKAKGIPVIVLIKSSMTITEDKMDSGDEKYNKMQLLDEFKARVKKDSNTVCEFEDINSLRHIASQSLKNSITYADENADWVRYKDVADVINEEIEGRKKAFIELDKHQSKLLEEMKMILSEFGTKLTNIEKNQISKSEIPVATKEDIHSLFRVEGEKLIIGSDYNVIDAAFLLVYAASGNGQIMKINTLNFPTCVSASGKQFMKDDTARESTRWVEALDILIEHGWVKPVGYKNQLFDVTRTGYQKADELKVKFDINTNKEPMEELKRFN